MPTKFSRVMTARANGVEPFEYLSYLFELLPSAVEAIQALLPWNVKSTYVRRKGRIEDQKGLADLKARRTFYEVLDLVVNSPYSGKVIDAAIEQLESLIRESVQKLQEQKVLEQQPQEQLQEQLLELLQALCDGARARDRRGSGILNSHVSATLLKLADGIDNILNR